MRVIEAHTMNETFPGDTTGTTHWRVSDGFGVRKVPEGVEVSRDNKVILIPWARVRKVVMERVTAPTVKKTRGKRKG